MSTGRSGQSAYTLVELMITLLVLAILAAIALPGYREYIERTKIKQAIRDIAELSMAIERYRTVNATYPDSLGDLAGNLPGNDPWGNAYRYLGIDVEPPPNVGAVRRDRNMNPLNNDFDLYSMGPDGQTQRQLTAAKARDDIVRAANGSFIGPAEDH